MKSILLIPRLSLYLLRMKLDYNVSSEGITVLSEVYIIWTWTWTWTWTSTSTCICVPYLDRDDEYDVEDVVSIVKTKVCLIILRSKCSSNLSRNDDVDAWAD